MINGKIIQQISRRLENIIGLYKGKSEFGDLRIGSYWGSVEESVGEVWWDVDYELRGTETTKDIRFAYSDKNGPYGVSGKRISYSERESNFITVDLDRACLTFEQRIKEIPTETTSLEPTKAELV